MSEEERSEGAENPAEDAPAPEQTPDEDAPASDDAPAANAPVDDASSEDAPADDAPAPQEPSAPEESEPEDSPEPEAPSASKGSKGEQPAAPGAELEPIAIEPERELSAEERARREAEEEERAAREAAATAEADEPITRREGKVELDADARIQATGKRKSSIARVILKSGNGTFEVNRRALEEYFPRPAHQTVARQALAASGLEDSLDVAVRVQGGGVSGQAGAVRHGVARALVTIDPELRGELKRRGMLTRDARAKERRKAGLKKARKRPQFSKR